jgi:choline transport protein
MQGILCLALGAIPLGSKTAFLDLAGSFIILSTVSYAIPIAGHLFNGRKTVKPGYFWMGKYGFVVQSVALAFIIFFDIFFCFRKYLVLDAELGADIA